MTNQQIVLDVSNLTKRIANRTLVEDVALQVHTGEIVGLLGPNGAGKSTLLRLIVGLVRKTSGEIKISGYHIDSQYERAMQGVGAVIEGPHFYEELTGYENLRMVSILSGGGSEDRIMQLATRAGLVQSLHQKLSTYSLGMRQRFGLLQAILHKPSLLLLDEPTNGLDPAGIRELRAFLLHVARVEQVAVVVSSHLLAEIEKICDRVVVMRRGQIIGQYGLEELVQTSMDQARVVFEVAPYHQDLALMKMIATYGNAEVVEVASYPPGLERVAIQVNVRADQIPSLHRIVVQAGVDLYSMRVKQLSLEEQYMAWVGGEHVVQSVES